MKVLVTGVAGFSGNVVARAVAAVGHEVTGLARKWQGDDPRYMRLVQASVSEAWLIEDRFDAVVHVAATSPDKAVTGDSIVRDNAFATAHLIDFCNRWKTKKFIFFSSLSVHGIIERVTVREDTPVRDPGLYGMTKSIGEELLRQSDMPSVALRLPGIIGPGARRNWLSQTAEKIINGLDVHAFHLDAPFNNAVHVNDIAKFVVSLLDRELTGHEPLVVSARGCTTVRLALERLAAGLGKKIEIVACEPEKSSFVLSPWKAINYFGFNPMTIEKTIDQYALDLLHHKETV